MSDLILHRTSCSLCGSRDLELVLQLAQVPIVDAYVTVEHKDEFQETYPLDISLCHSCGHSQLRDVLDPEILYGDYLYFTARDQSLVDHFKKYAERALERGGPPDGSLVVDIGSNDGTLLKFFQDRGLRVLGIDPAREIANKATESGLETWPVFFSAELAHRIREERGPAAIVTVNNLFANVDDLADMIEGIRGMLAPDGLFVFETFYLADLIENMAFDFIYHEHLSCYSAKPLQTFFRAHGMELVDVERVPTKGGSLRGFVRLAGSSPEVSPSVAKLISLETELGIHSSEVFKGLSSRIDLVKNRLDELLGQIEADGKTVAGYGASAASTTLIYQFELGEKLSFIADDNPVRFNLYSPGHHIPVIASQAIYDNNTDYVLILAWRHREPIVKRHQPFLERGGHFIVPVPEVEVI